MSEITIYHNPRCSKSRQAVQLLEEAGKNPKTVLYLEQPPTVEELTAVLKKLGKSAFDILRKADLKKAELTLPESEKELIELMVQNPILIERPIAVCGGKAVVGRPPELVLEL